MWNSSKKGYITNLLAPYDQQIFFLEHYTISVSPIENTLTIAKLFPKGTYFHIISHSRGGIIGELLCQSQITRRKKKSKRRFVKSDIIFSRKELSYFKKDTNRQADYEGLKDLQQLFSERKFSVERFVRIAAPMHGTALASESIDEVVSKVFNTLNSIPLPHILGIRRFLSSLAFTFIKKARSVELMPGIESMMPSSPLIQLLNRPSVKLQNELIIIAGEVTSKKGMKEFKNKWLHKNIFKENHDLVVNVSAAFGGCSRLGNTSRYYLERSSEIGHFNYFQHATILQKIQEALTHPLGTVGTFQLLLPNNRGDKKAHYIEKLFGWKRFIPKHKKWQSQLIKRFIIKAEGLVSNTLNKLFYIPSSDGWQTHDSGADIFKNQLISNKS